MHPHVSPNQLTEMGLKLMHFFVTRLKLRALSHLPRLVWTFRLFSLIRTKFTGVKPPSDQGDLRMSQEEYRNLDSHLNFTDNTDYGYTHSRSLTTSG